jgi:hypothetical protein
VPIPSVYDEAGLATFLLAEARSVAAAFGWASQADVQEVINETLLAYGSISDISGATDIRKLRVIARYYIWKAAVEQAAGKIPVSAGTGTGCSSKRWQRLIWRRTQPVSILPISKAELIPLPSRSKWRISDHLRMIPIGQVGGNERGRRRTKFLSECHDGKW